MSASTTAFVLQKNMKDNRLTWNGGKEWQNFTADEVRKFENDCESQFNNEADVKKCVESKIKSSAESGKSGNINWGAAANNAIDFFNQYRDNKIQADSNSTYVPYGNTTKKSNGALIGVAVVGGLALVGVGVWYFGFRK